MIRRSRSPAFWSLKVFVIALFAHGALSVVSNTGEPEDLSQSCMRAILEASAVAEQELASSIGSTAVQQGQILQNRILSDSHLKTTLDQTVKSYLLSNLTIGNDGLVTVEIELERFQVEASLDLAPGTPDAAFRASGTSHVAGYNHSRTLNLDGSQRRFVGDRILKLDGICYLEVLGIGPIPDVASIGSRFNNRDLALRAAEAFGLSRLVGILQGRRIFSETEMNLKNDRLSYQETMSNTADGEASRWSVVSRVFDESLQLGFVRIQVIIPGSLRAPVVEPGQPAPEN